MLPVQLKTDLFISEKLERCDAPRVSLLSVCVKKELVYPTQTYFRQINN